MFLKVNWNNLEVIKMYSVSTTFETVELCFGKEIIENNAVYERKVRVRCRSS